MLLLLYYVFTLIHEFTTQVYLSTLESLKNMLNIQLIPANLLTASSKSTHIKEIKIKYFILMKLKKLIVNNHKFNLLKLIALLLMTIVELFLLKLDALKFIVLL